MIQINLTREEFNQCLVDLTSVLGSTNVSRGNSGSISEDGCIVTYTYTEPILYLNISKKPFFLSFNVIENRIKEWFDKEKSKQITNHEQL